MSKSRRSPLPRSRRFWRKAVRQLSLPILQPPLPAAAGAAVDEDKVCRSPVAGIAVKSNVRPGQTILPGDLLFVLESMKMETEITAPVGGKVGEVKVSVGDSVKSGQVVLTWA